MHNKILVIAAHSDDEVLGCGGTIARHAAQGDDVAVLFMTDGVGARIGAGNNKVTRRKAASNQALKILGCTKYINFDFPDNAMDSRPLLEIVNKIEDFCSEWGSPSTVYTHHPNDLNIDHQVTHAATMACFRPQPKIQPPTKKILSFEVPSSTGWNGSLSCFNPNYYVDITPFTDMKIRALESYADEMRPWPHARSFDALEALAKYRGSTVGYEAAEAFVVERILD